MVADMWTTNEGWEQPHASDVGGNGWGEAWRPLDDDGWHGEAWGSEVANIGPNVKWSNLLQSFCMHAIERSGIHDFIHCQHRHWLWDQNLGAYRI